MPLSAHRSEGTGMSEIGIVKVSSQGQVTLRRAVRKALGDPKHLEAWIENGTLMLRPAISATLDEAVCLFGKQGITRDVLVEALRTVKARRRRNPSS
jgi:bifunctional DNA-binding transcriptional regulator/antitoxin component of YhaV-PrlF toxin-antitoxin module